MRAIYALLLLLILTSCTGSIKSTHEVSQMRQLSITSPAFQNGEGIPSKYTCDGENISPPLTIKGIPNETQSLALIVDDPDAPAGTWVHWIVWNIAPAEDIQEDMVPGDEGINSFKKHAYGGPCPPSGTHRYFFRVYALDTNLSLGESAVRPDVEKAMEGHIIAQGEIMGTYSRG